MQILNQRNCMSDAFACNSFHIFALIHPFEAVMAAQRRPLSPQAAVAFLRSGDPRVTKAAARLLVGDLRQSA
ncbi:hypothetical protein [Amycolatopsis sp. NPDC004079]|uniref:hypothetical protein n=1 Tax=Amycolatopsis sp. NPDC004079 TaxID=3154549 RepID=UPI0033B99DB8